MYHGGREGCIWFKLDSEKTDKNTTAKGQFGTRKLKLQLVWK